jgi:nitroreductase
MAEISSLLQARYGTAASGAGIANPTLETVLQHKSVRAFLPETLAPGTLELLVAAGQSAATSSNLQTWSVVAIEDSERKDKAASLSGGQDFIRDAPVFLIFCADLSRLKHVSEQQQTPGEGLEYLEMFLMASLDATLAAQNIAIAAESLGLGVCYVGGARNNPRELAELLHLPHRVIAVFGLAVGKPDPAKPAFVKPRLPLEEVLHRETWNDDARREYIAAYDETLATFNGTQNRADIPSWTQRSATRVSKKENLTGRHIWVDVLKERGFDLR